MLSFRDCRTARVLISELLVKTTILLRGTRFRGNTSRSLSRHKARHSQRRITSGDQQCLFQLQVLRERPLRFASLCILCELLQGGHGACGVIYTLSRLGASVAFSGGIMLRHWLLLLLTVQHCV